ncbi:MAG: large subunit ribosomal protein L24 [Acidimicrobiales bacterium]|jgi:large subunit ribosomal protein L24
MRVRKGDNVRIMSGKDRGRDSVISAAFPATGKVMVEGYNIAKRHTKPASAEEPGGILDKEMPMDASNVAVISPGDGKPTRVGYKLLDDGSKVRVCKRTGAEIPEVNE